ncbi:MAG: hypothetical protein QXO21_02465 [Candidatus Anstonellales archaeon]
MRIIIGIIIFLVGVIYAIKTALTIAKNGYDAVAFLDLSSIIKGVALPIPIVVAFLISLAGIIIAYGSKNKK